MAAMVLLQAQPSMGQTKAGSSKEVPCTTCAIGQHASVGYVDRVIDAAALGKPGDVDEAEVDRSGLPRYFRIEARHATVPSGRVWHEPDAIGGRPPQRSAESGLAAVALVETENYGALSLNAQLTQQGLGWLTFRQRDLALGRGWVADHDVGVIERSAPGLAVFASRLALPNAQLLGMSGRWSRDDRSKTSTIITAGAGRAGWVSSLPTLSFERAPGHRFMFGAAFAPAQLEANALAAVDVLHRAGAAAAEPGAVAWSMTSDRMPGWSGSLLAETASDVLPYGAAGFTSVNSGRRMDARSLHAAIGHVTTGTRAQAQMILTRATDPSGAALQSSSATANGFWADVEIDGQNVRHQAGLYRLDAGLSWVDQPMPQGVQGAYYRANWKSRQWVADASIDALSRLPQDGLDQAQASSRSGFYGAANARWRASRISTIGAGFAARNYHGRASSAYLDWRWSSSLGASGLRAEHQDDGRSSATRVGWDQDWHMPTGYALSSSVSLAQSADAGRSVQTALAWSVPLGTYASIRGSLSAQHDLSAPGSSTRSTGANISGNWRLSKNWSLDAQWSQSRSASTSWVLIDPLAPMESSLRMQSTNSYLITLRYEHEAGSMRIPLGGKSAAGAGALVGVVFFDGNRSFAQEAQENGVPGVTVVLDGRWSVRTDAQGRFEFPLVAAGRHRIQVRNDTLPLPWTVDSEDAQDVEVQVRATQQVLIGVRKPI